MSTPEPEPPSTAAVDAAEAVAADSDVVEDRLVRARARRQQALDDEEIPRLPRGRGFRLSTGQLLKIGLTAGLLVMLLLVQRPCAENVSNFVIEMDHKGSGSASVMPRPYSIEPAGSGNGSGSATLNPDDYEVIRPDMTEAEIKAAIERSRAKAEKK